MMMDDPLSRIRFYPLHVMLVAVLLENGELVGVVRGCIKTVGTHSGSILKMGCILGFRVSPTYRRKGVGLKLISSVEEWMVRNGAEYTLLATEKKNEASRNLFTIKCNYLNLSSLSIFVHPIRFPAKHISRDIKIEKLNIDQAISLYKRTLKAKELFPIDMDAILKEKLSLGTWVFSYKDETPSSWIIFSLWDTCETSYKLQLRKPHRLLGFLNAALNQAREKILPCLRMSVPFGFIFVYGLHGEGENLGELMESIWRFTSRLGERMKGCKMIITELGLADPLANLVPQTASRIDDLWFIKRLSGQSDEKDVLLMKREMGNVFVDPRDF